MTVATRNDACSGALGLFGEERTKKIECKMHNRVVCILLCIEYDSWLVPVDYVCSMCIILCMHANS